MGLNIRDSSDIEESLEETKRDVLDWLDTHDLGYDGPVAGTVDEFFEALIEADCDDDDKLVLANKFQLMVHELGNTLL